MVIEKCQCLRLNCTAWFARADFQRFLNGIHTDGAKLKLPNNLATWHRRGEPPGEYSDVFVTYDNGDGSDMDDLPDDIWEEICRLCRTYDVKYGVVWLVNALGLEGFAHG